MRFSFLPLATFLVESIEALYRLRVRGFSTLPQRMLASISG